MWVFPLAPVGSHYEGPIVHHITSASPACQIWPLSRSLSACHCKSSSCLGLKVTASYNKLFLGPFTKLSWLKSSSPDWVITTLRLWQDRQELGQSFLGRKTTNWTGIIDWLYIVGKVNFIQLNMKCFHSILFPWIVLSKLQTKTLNINLKTKPNTHNFFCVKS